MWCIRLVKIRIEDRLSSGERICVSLEGDVLDERKLVQIVELLRILSGRELSSAMMEEPSNTAKVSLKEIIWDAIVERFGEGRWFTSKELRSVLVKEYGVQAKLSTVSTYLHRLFTSGYLERGGSRALRRYRLNLSKIRATA